MRLIEEKMGENRLRWFRHVEHRPIDAPVRKSDFSQLGGAKREGEKKT